MNPELKPAYVVKIKDTEILLEGGYGMAQLMFKVHPAWCGNYRLVYKDGRSGLYFVEGDKRFICYEYLYTEKLSLDEALSVCPEVMI